MLITFTGITYSFHNNFNHRSSSTKNLHSTTEFMRTLHSQLNMNNQNSDSSSLSTSNFDSSSNSLSKKIFCNVELNGQSVEAVGFDMDFTLAQVYFTSPINLYKNLLFV